jgi:sigma-B regulation protein RsbU (phosphoserine phosphatase)
MKTMASVTENIVRRQLVERRQRLEDALRQYPEATQFTHLLGEVDAALARVEAGTYGLCEVCHDTIEQDRIMADPLVRFCLDHLSEAEQRALEQDLQLAARIQRALLPERSMSCRGWEIHYHYEPAGPVSGDYCDVVRPDGGAGDLYFLFGDVSGKGVSAAILMSHLHATFRSLVAAEFPVGQLVERANRVFRESTLSPYFATLVAGRASASGELEICNAGHCPPLVLTDCSVASVDPTGLPVGTFYATSYSSKTLKLGAGDTVILYTDGLSEARDRNGSEYGAERISRVLAASRHSPPEAIVAACLADLAHHLSGAPKTDDLTLMVIRRAT